MSAKNISEYDEQTSSESVYNEIAGVAQENDEEIIIKHAERTVYNNPNKGIMMLVVWLLLTGGAACYAGIKIELWPFYLFVIQGIIGFTLFFTSDRDKKSRNMFIYTLIVAVLAVGTAFLSIAFPDQFAVMSGRFLTNIVLSALTAAGGAIFVYGIFNDGRLKRQCSLETKATVNRLKTQTRFGRTSYCPVYRFSHDEKKYEACEFKYARKNIPKKNDTVSIFIDPYDPVTIREPKRARRERTASIIGGLALLIIGLALITVFAATSLGIFER